MPRAGWVKPESDQRLSDHIEILDELLPERRPRANPRVVKRKMSSYQLKHAYHRNAPTIHRRPIVCS
ncbi:hypothetical protein [Mycobacterium ostraviense]|uniref:hypothetical protein n=1 Tax=Mycobacterium ostraviense TaxID=2738409 RepID=UPI000C080581|nr:hypothetical protein [Mycobacterium ostraviense]